jgi:hypothetical protein
MEYNVLRMKPMRTDSSDVKCQFAVLATWYCSEETLTKQTKSVPLKFPASSAPITGAINGEARKSCLTCHKYGVHDSNGLATFRYDFEVQRSYRRIRGETEWVLGSCPLQSPRKLRRYYTCCHCPGR